MSTLDLNDIQGNILLSYRMPTARYGFYRFGNELAGRELIQALLPYVTTSKDWPIGDDGKPIKPDATLNLGFTYRGLAALGLPAASLVTFPDEFQEGMQARAEVLGDDRASAPANWEPMWHQEIHAWISINAKDEVCLERQAARLSELVASVRGVVEVGRQYAARLPGAKEHFGFTDGISDPDVAGRKSAGSEKRRDTRIGKLDGQNRWQPMASGEFLLGHPDEAQETSAGPQPLMLARNGTFMVYRKLHQNVASFRRYLRQEGARYGNEELLAAKMVGRWRDGTPLALSPDKEAPEKIADNSFTYADDPDGRKCPLTAHIRRVNPRDALGFGGALTNRRRIVRRGLPYGDLVPDGPGDDDGEHGVIFMAINASIERQFEFVQAAWVNNGNSFGLANDKDPITGNHQGSGRMVVPGHATSNSVKPPYICADLPRFVVTRGGEYFFLPSMTALRMLASGRVDMR